MSDPDPPLTGDLISRLHAAYLAGIPVPERPTSLRRGQTPARPHLETGLSRNGQASVGVTPGPGSEREGFVLTQPSSMMTWEAHRCSALLA